MKKKLIILPIIAAGIGAHYFAWQTQTAKLADGLTMQIAKLNENSKDKFTYAERKTSGYPSNSVVSFTKPKVKNAQGELLIEGDLSFAASLLGDKITAQSNGAIIANNGEKSYKITSKDGLKCSISADSIVDFITANEELKQGNFSEVAKKIRQVNCNIEDFAMIDGDKIIATAKLYDMSFNSSPSAKTTNIIDFSVQANDVEMKESNLFEENIWGAEYGDLVNLKYSNLGKQNFVLSGGAVFDESNPAKFQFNMREFKASNDLYSIDFPIEIISDGKVMVKHSGSFNFNEKFDAANIDLAKHFLSNIKQGKDAKIISKGIDEKIIGDDTIEIIEEPNSGMISEEVAEKIKGGEIDEAIFINAVPQLQKFSQIQTYFNANGELSAMSGEFEKIGFSTPLFALILSGKTSGGDGEIEINCQNCESLIKTFTGYANDVAKMLHSVGETGNPEIFSTQAIDAIIGFTEKYDSSDNDKDITWKISKKGAKTDISGKTMEQFMIDSMEIMPLIPAINGL